MEEQTRVLEYKCPCCNAGLHFGSDAQKLTCEYCGNTFDIDTVRAFNESQKPQDAEEFQWEQEQTEQFSEDEESTLRAFQCPSCGGEILCDENTAASFCPYCENPTIMPTRLSGGLKPDGVIPFKTGKEDAKAAFLRLCKGKPLLPRGFTSEQRLEKITGMYVPFWLYDCAADFSGSYKATRIHTWSDSKYEYTKTDHFLLKRDAAADFVGIPMDGSTKMEDAFMESIEPFDYKQLTSFDMAYLTGYLADKYDVSVQDCAERADSRCETSAVELMEQDARGDYTSCTVESRNVTLHRGKVHYALMPVWLLSTKWNGKSFLFAMNGQTGKLVGDLPLDKGLYWKHFAAITGLCMLGVMAAGLLLSL